MNRPFVADLDRYNGCHADETPIGRCLVLGVKIWSSAKLVARLREAAELRSRLIPEFLPFAAAVATWDAAAYWRCVDENGDLWVVFSDAALARAVFSNVDLDDADQLRATMRNWWWLGDALPREAFWVLGREHTRIDSSEARSVGS